MNSISLSFYILYRFSLLLCRSKFFSQNFATHIRRKKKCCANTKNAPRLYTYWFPMQIFDRSGTFIYSATHWFFFYTFDIFGIFNRKKLEISINDKFALLYKIWSHHFTVIRSWLIRIIVAAIITFFISYIDDSMGFRRDLKNST